MRFIRGLCLALQLYPIPYWFRIIPHKRPGRNTATTRLLPGPRHDPDNDNRSLYRKKKYVYVSHLHRMRLVDGRKGEEDSAIDSIQTDPRKTREPPLVDQLAVNHSMTC